MKKLISLTLAALMLSTLLLSSCGGGDTNSPNSGSSQQAGSTPAGVVASTKDTLVIALDADPENLDPHEKNNQSVAKLKKQIYECLVYLDDNMEVQPLLAESWEWQDDTTLVFHLRKGVYFHNGEELKASDVLFTFNRILDVPAAATALEMVDVPNCYTEDDYTVVVKLYQPYQIILAQLAWPLTAILNEKAYTEANGDFWKAPVGTGPYKFSEWHDGDRVELVANDNYWEEGVPYIKNLTFRIITDDSTRAVELENGAIDVCEYLATIDMDRIESNPNLAVVNANALNIRHISFKCNKVPTDDAKLREALCYAINSEAIRNTVFLGIPEKATTFVPPDLWGANPDAASKACQYNVEKAKALLAEAGYSDGLTLVGIFQNNNEGIAIAEILKNNLAQVGINLEANIYDNATFLDKLCNPDDDWNLTYNGVTALTGEIDSALRKFYSTSAGGVNTSRYANPEFDRLVDTAAATLDENERLNMYAEAQNMIGNDFVWKPIYVKLLSCGINNKLQNFSIDKSFECHMYKYCYFN